MHKIRRKRRAYTQRRWLTTWRIFSTFVASCSAIHIRIGKKCRNVEKREREAKNLWIVVCDSSPLARVLRRANATSSSTLLVLLESGDESGSHSRELFVGSSWGGKKMLKYRLAAKKKRTQAAARRLSIRHIEIEICFRQHIHPSPIDAFAQIMSTWAVARVLRRRTSDLMTCHIEHKCALHYHSLIIRASYCSIGKTDRLIETRHVHQNQTTSQFSFLLCFSRCIRSACMLASFFPPLNVNVK